MEVTCTSDEPDDDSPDIRKLFALLQDFKAKHGGSIPRFFEMSHETFYRIEHKFNPLPFAEPHSRLWGIEIAFNETLPVDTIKSIYSDERTRTTSQM